MRTRLKERILLTHQIRSAILHNPDGICFAAPDGRLILANDAINRLCSRLTGHTMINAEEAWQEWRRFCRERQENQAEEQLLLELPEGICWQLSRRKLSMESGEVLQITASDITGLRKAQRQLEEDNRRLTELQGRQRELLENIVRNNRETEILNAKMQIHSRFGTLLVAGAKLLREPAEEQLAGWLSDWENLLSAMEHADFDYSRNVPAPQAELFRAAEMIGCRICLEGAFPPERKACLLLASAIREALTNAVRHGGADVLYVKVQPDEQMYAAEITDNGTGAASQIHEGGGLSALREKLEQEGGSLHITGGPAVRLRVSIPKEEQEEGR